MSLPRPLLLGLLGLAIVLLAPATFLLVRGQADREVPAATAERATQAAAGATPAAAGAAPTASGQAAAPVAGVPPPVLAALAQRKLVVLLFSQAVGADDAATRATVAALEGAVDPGLAVFQADVAELPRYRPLLRDVGITQVPAVVLVDSRRRARLLEGYLDEGSLRQHVADLRG